MKLYNESLNNWNFALSADLSQNTSVTLVLSSLLERRKKVEKKEITILTFSFASY